MFLETSNRKQTLFCSCKIERNETQWKVVEKSINVHLKSKENHHATMNTGNYRSCKRYSSTFLLKTTVRWDIVLVRVRQHSKTWNNKQGGFCSSSRTVHGKRPVDVYNYLLEWRRDHLKKGDNDLTELPHFSFERITWQINVRTSASVCISRAKVKPSPHRTASTSTLSSSSFISRTRLDRN